MADKLIFPVTLGASLGCGLMAGTFFAFSTFIMGALAQLPSAQGIAAMQAINVTVINPLFMGVLFGTALLAIFLGIVAVVRWNTPSAPYILVGSVCYFLGTIVVTIACNVPLNNALAVANPASAASVSQWSSFLAQWTAWNHVRAIASLAAMASYIIAVTKNGR